MTGYSKGMEECDIIICTGRAVAILTGDMQKGKRCLLDGGIYEQERMLATLERMLYAIADRHPVLLILNRFSAGLKESDAN